MPATDDSRGLDREILVLGAVVVLGAIMTVFDLTIVNVAIPTLGRELGASISAVQWVLTGYMLAFASVIPLSGWATERFGAKRLWIASLAAFVAGSALAGAAWSIGSLIGFRVLQGLGAGMILPVGQTMLARAAGPARMGRVMSVIGVPMLLAPVFGPVVGGAILDQASWRWIFFLNLPVGALALLAARRLLPEASPRRGVPLDLRGLALLPPGIALFLYGMSAVGARGGLDDARTIAATAGGLALVALFVRHARGRGREALVDVSLFARRGFATAAAANFLLPIALFGALLLLPLYYQVVRRESPLEVGLLLAPQGLGAAIVMPFAGLLTDRLGPRLVVSTGIALAAAGTLAFTRIEAGTSYVYLAAALLVLGAGAGSTIMPAMAAAFRTLAGDETPRATSALNAVQRIAGAIGTALLAVVLQRAIATGVPDAPAGIQALASLPPAEHARAAPPLADAFATSFRVALGLIAVALVPALLLPGRAREERQSSEPEAGTTVEREAA